MIRVWLDRVLDSRLVVPISAGITLALGLAFIFVRAPHPWTWFGIDQYHPLAAALAAGGSFATTDVPWGYPYYLAAFYWLFGPTPWPALVGQALLNTAVPVLVYRLAADNFDRRVASVAAILTALLSFNTVYASTESTDSISTVMFMAAVVLTDRARREMRWRPAVVAGVVCGLAAQFRPNLIVTPVVLAAILLWSGRERRARLWQAAGLLLATALVLAPWTIRNYRLTGLFLPTSTHGPVQLWYGSLQTGSSLTSMAYNPRRAFEPPAFDYTSLLDAPVVLQVDLNQCAPGAPQAATLVYWTDQDTTPRRVALSTGERPGSYTSVVPAGEGRRVLYYFFETAWASGPSPTVTPADGAARPFVYFLSDDHLRDLDRHHDFMDVFDAVSLMRHLAWGDALGERPVDMNRDGAMTEADLRLLVGGLLGDPGLTDGGPVREFVADAQWARATLRDGSTISVPRLWDGLLTDVTISHGLVARLVWARWLRETASPITTADACRQLLDAGANRVFYRQEPHHMRRYGALAWDNIRREPIAYAVSVAYRWWRLFVVMGSDDPRTAHQFERSRAVYGGAMLASSVYLLMAATGVWLARSRWRDLWPLLALIVHIPATISFMLTNMRYTVTVQPLIFILIAVTVVAALGRLGWLGRPASATAPR